jgi:hypothetical protein
MDRAICRKLSLSAGSNMYATAMNAGSAGRNQKRPLLSQRGSSSRRDRGSSDAGNDYVRPDITGSSSAGRCSAGVGADGEAKGLVRRRGRSWRGRSSPGACAGSPSGWRVPTARKQVVFCCIPTTTRSSRLDRRTEYAGRLSVGRQRHRLHAPRRERDHRPKTRRRP